MHEREDCDIGNWFEKAIIFIVLRQNSFENIVATRAQESRWFDLLLGQYTLR